MLHPSLYHPPQLSVHLIVISFPHDPYKQRIAAYLIDNAILAAINAKIIRTSDLLYIGRERILRKVRDSPHHL
jgi:hypothetical protein